MSRGLRPVSAAMAMAMRWEAYGTKPPAWLRTNRMFGYRRTTPLWTSR